MRKLLSLSMIVFSIFFLVGCDLITYEEAEEFIDQCRADEQCYAIVDDVIQEELDARGIVQGTITGLEMKAIYELFDSFKSSINIFNYFLENDFGTIRSAQDNMWYPPENTIMRAIGEMTSHINFSTQIDLGTFLSLVYEFEDFELNALYTQGKQYLFIENQKHIIYRIGLDRYKYEIVSESTTREYIIDMTFGSVGTPYVSIIKDDFIAFDQGFNDVVYTDDYIYKNPYYTNTGSPSHQFMFISKDIMISGVIWYHTDIIALGVSQIAYNSDGKYNVIENYDQQMALNNDLETAYLPHNASVDTIIEMMSSGTSNIELQEIIRNAFTLMLK